MKNRWTRVLLFLLCLCLLVQPALADGLLPGVGTLYGEYMPRAAYALGREPAETGKDNGAQTEMYASVTGADWEKLGIYLSGWGCRADAGSRDGEKLTVNVSKDKLSITLVYDRASAVLTVTYPKGTRPEAAKNENARTEKDILPVLREKFGIEMPDFEKCFGKKPARESTDASGVITRVFTGAGEEDYTAFSVYAGDFGCVLNGYTYQNGVVTCELGREGAAFTFAFDLVKKEAVLVYPADTWVTARSYTKKSGTGILPSPDTLYGVYLPSFAYAVMRQPDGENALADNTVEQVYSGFTDADYNAVSAFIAERGCTVAGYTVEGGVMDIVLEKAGKTFTFVYDRENSVARVLYPAGTRPERAVLVTPTPVPTATAKPTPKPTATSKPKNYTREQCWDIALKRLKYDMYNPNSLILDDTYSWREQDGCYVFTISYRGQNRLGGYARNTAVITVDYTTGTVVNIFSW